MQAREPLAIQALRYTAVTAVALAVLSIVLAVQRRASPPVPPRVFVEPSPGYPVRIIQIAKQEIRYQGRLITTVDTVLRVDSPTFFVDGLKDALDADAARSFRPGQWLDLEKLQLSRMVLVELDDETPAEVERKVLYTTSFTGWQPIVHYVRDLR